MQTYNVDYSTSELLGEVIDANKWKEEKREQTLIFYTYVIDKPAVEEKRLVAEYPNGGKDYKPIVVEPEEGHFTVKYEDGRDFTYPIDVPKGISKDGPVPDLVEIAYWRKMSQAEIDKNEKEMEQQKIEQEEAQAKAEAQQAFLETAPEEFDAVKEAQDDIILMLADIVGGAV